MHYRAEVEGCGLTTTYPNPPNPFSVFIQFSVSAIQSLTRPERAGRCPAGSQVRCTFAA